MTGVMSHRGPDDSGTWHAEGVGLAHTRLSIIDLSAHGHEPMSSLDDPSLHLVYNGEIYNFPELREELLQKGHRFSSKTDAEVLLHLYEEMGSGLLDRLNGIFAFALWDGRRSELLLARDQLGVKPLYYTTAQDRFLFASEIKGVLTAPWVSRELDLVAMHQMLAYLWTPAPRTALAAVKKLPPGHAMTVKDGRIQRLWQYYDLPYGQPREPIDEASAAEALREHLAKAVDRQLLSDVPVGAFLSGGLDSSAVVAMMRKAQPDSRPRCYSIGFQDGRDLEGSPQDLPYAQQVAAHLDVDLHPIVVGPESIENLSRMLYHLDEPQADPAPINALLIAEQASRDGIKVLMSGAGGDDIFSGYRRHHALRLERLWGWLPGFARQRLAQLSRSSTLNRAAPRRLLRAFAYADLGAEQRLISYFHWAPESLRRTLYSSDVAVELEGCDVSEPLMASLDNIPQERDPLNRMLYLETKHFLADHNLNYTDKMGMAAGVEVRVPLLDRDLVDFAARLPSGLKQRGREGKFIFKRAMEPYLPKSVVYRPKTGFGAPVRRWVNRELTGLVDDLLSQDSITRRGVFNPHAVGELVRDTRSGRVDGSYSVFALLCYETWCRQFVD
jgi:asparagine synthase (glutamine-hydrolysing)